MFRSGSNLFIKLIPQTEIADGDLHFGNGLLASSRCSDILFFSSVCNLAISNAIPFLTPYLNPHPNPHPSQKLDLDLNFPNQVPIPQNLPSRTKKPPKIPPVPPKHDFTIVNQDNIARPAEKPTTFAYFLMK